MPLGEVNRWLQAGQYDKALAAAADYRDIMGQGNFYIELMDHGLPVEGNYRADLLKIARSLDLPFCWPPTICTTCTRAMPTCTMSCCASALAPRWTTPSAILIRRP